MYLGESEEQLPEKTCLLTVGQPLAYTHSI